MATHDYDIANQSGAAFRTDLNNALAAIQSNNSNSSSPATTVAYQWWADTSAGTLKIRNSSNNAWIELFQLDGTLTLEDGSQSAPALAFRDDLDTGIFSAGANQINFATNGVPRLDISNSNTVFNEGGADIDFRIESDGNANMFKIDAGNNRIGIGEGSPSTTLHVNGDLTITEKIIHNGDSNTFISFTADDNVIIQTGGAERFRVADLGTTISTTTDASLFINSSASGGAHLRFQTSGTTKSFIGQAEGISGTLGSADDLGFRSAAKINFATNNSSTKRLEIETGGDVKVSTGNLVIGTSGKGIDFSATADSSATGATDTSELFQDYEEGSWTPIYQNNDNSPTFDVQTGRYTKVGRFVYCTGRLSVQGGTALETNDGSGVNIGGLPFSGNSDHHACLLTLGRFLSIFQDGGANVNTVRFGGNFILLMTANGNEVTYSECNAFGDLTFALSYQL
tara:strand:- start:649 stop:2013 length:1365 start_codon:yes stop_codon:yes gene_type:complete